MAAAFSARARVSHPAPDGSRIVIAEVTDSQGRFVHLLLEPEHARELARAIDLEAGAIASGAA